MASHWRRPTKEQDIVSKCHSGRAIQVTMTHHSWHSTHDGRLELCDVPLAVSHARVGEGLDLSVPDRHPDKDPRRLDNDLENVCEWEEGEVQVRVVENLVQQRRDGGDGRDQVAVREDDSLRRAGRALSIEKEDTRSATEDM